MEKKVMELFWINNPVLSLEMREKKQEQRKALILF